MSLLLGVQKGLINAEECDCFEQDPSDTRLKTPEHSPTRCLRSGTRSRGQPRQTHWGQKAPGLSQTNRSRFWQIFFHPADAHDRLQDITVYKAEINLAFHREWQVVAWGRKSHVFMNATKVCKCKNVYTWVRVTDLRETGTSKIKSPEKQFAEIFMWVRKKLHTAIPSTLQKRNRSSSLFHDRRNR